MSSDPRRAKPVRLPGEIESRDTDRPGNVEPLTAGVPLVKLIKRKLVKSKELVLARGMHSVAAERFRRLKTILVNEHGDDLRSIVVTSPGPGEGKSLVSMNLAMAFARESDEPVLLVDADIRRPGIARWLDPQPNFGLAEVLAGKTELSHTLIDIESPQMKILPAGAPTRDPMDLLSSDAAGDLFRSLRQRFRWVIIDTPPIVPFTDADVIGCHTDGMLLVARSGKTQQGMIQRAVQSVTSTRVLGTVLNDTTFNLADRGYYHEKYYHDYYDRKDDSTPSQEG